MLISNKSTRKSVQIALWMCGLVVFLLGAATVADRTVDLILQKDTKIVARAWARHVADRMPDLEGVLRGEAAPPETRRFLEAVTGAGGVYRFKLFDSSGALRFISDQRTPRNTGRVALAKHNPTAADAIANGRAFFALKRGDGIAKPLRYSETYLPLIGPDGVVGAAEVYVDETERIELLRRELFWTGTEFYGVLVAAFLIPGAAFFWRSRQLQVASAKLFNATHSDLLTGLMNRNALNKLLKTRESEAKRSGGAFAVLFVDMDHFKQINDDNGHVLGDAILRDFAGRVAGAVGKRGRIARIGGDKLAVCLSVGLDATEIETLAAEIIWRCAKPYRAESTSIRTSATIGYALLGPHGASAEQLMRNADIALHAAKKAGGGCALCFTAAMEAERRNRRRIEEALRRALAEDAFELHYQPLLCTKTDALCGFEALLRLSDAEGAAIDPTDFIPVAEDIGAITELGRKVLRRACRTAASWPAPLRIAVNLSPAQFIGGDVVRDVAEALKQSGLDAARLELEVTESLLIDNVERVFAVLEELKGLGVSLALDDFGTGYSSLSYLWRLPFDKLKVDRSFITDLARQGSKSEEILRTIVALGKVLQLTVTAEGVETLDQAKIVSALDCDQIQGFLIGRPMPAADIAVLVKTKTGPDPAAVGV